MKRQEVNQYIVMGLGVSGRSAIRFLLREGYQVMGIDDHLKIDEELLSFQQEGVQFYSALSQQMLIKAQCVVKSPGVPDSHRVIQKAKLYGIPVVGDMELVARTIQDLLCIGITGTNGKTTVSLLVEHLLQSAGRKFRVCGNVGVPITDVVAEGDCQGLVIEMSSYQLETLATPFLDIAVFLNITPDHLDRYASFDDYFSVKLRIFSLLKPGGRAFMHRSVKHHVGQEGEIYGGHDGLTSEVLRKFRNHDLDNIDAAFHVCKCFGLSDNQLVDALFTFKKPPHRIELVGRARGVSFYNDSKGTNIDAVKTAVNAMEGDVVLIAGGVDKESSYASWKQTFAGKVKKICAIGEAAPKIEEQLGLDIPIQLFDGLYQAVSHAVGISKPGDNILLSPGCASFDMFRDYQHRGDEFKRIVHSITIGE